MTEISAPWGGTSLGDAGTRAPYSDQEWAQHWRELLRAAKPSSGPLLGTGVSPDPGLTVQATGPASASVDITTGSALVRGTWYNTNVTVNKSIAANSSGNPRIDTIVLRKDYAAQTVRLAVLQGTPAGSPSAPTLTQTDGVTWETPLADIAVANGFSTIANANITPRHEWANAADGVYLFDVLNNSGGLLETGDVVAFDTTADRAVKTTTTVADPLTAGVWVGRTPAGGYGRVLVRGIGYVKTSGAVATRGLVLIASGTVKTAAVQAASDTSGKVSSIGITIQVTSGAGLALAFVDVQQQRLGAIAQSIAQKGSDTASNSITFIDVDAVNYKITITPSTSRVRVRMGFNGGSSASGVWCSEYDILRVGGSRAGHATHGLGACSPIPGAGTFLEDHIEIEGIFTGLTPGTSYEFRLQFRSTSASNSAFVYGSLGEVVNMIAEDLR